VRHRPRHLAAGIAPRLAATAALTAAVAVMSACGPTDADKTAIRATPEGAHVQAWIDTMDAMREAVDGINDEATARAALPELTRLKQRMLELQALDAGFNEDKLKQAAQVLHNEKLTAGKRLDTALTALPKRHPAAARIVEDRLKAVTPATAPS